jgi:hypothetical protein
MGTYDTVHDGDRFEQVKLWGKGLRHLHVGDTVGLPRGGLGPDGVYTVVMRLGGYIHVVNGVIAGWHDEPGVGPQLTTGGYRFDPADWPGGPFGGWYPFADAPPGRRTPYDAAEECPGPRLTLLGDQPGVDAARAVMAADVAARLAVEPTEAERLEAARSFLSDTRGYAAVACEAVARLLGVEQEPDVAGARLVRLFSSLRPGDAEWTNAARTVARYAAVLPADAVARCLHLLAAALSAPESETDGRTDDDDLAHPAFRRRRSRISRYDAFLDRLGRYGELDFQAAAEAAVARHGAAVLPAVPLRFWGRDVVVAEVAVPLLRPLLGRELTTEEEPWVLDALLDVPGTLVTLESAVLHEALARTVRR